MGEVVNLRIARKRKVRADHQRQAAENRAAHGRSKGEAMLADTIRDQVDGRLEAHRRVDRVPDGDA
jgi:hypothetical protein